MLYEQREKTVQNEELCHCITCSLQTKLLLTIQFNVVVPKKFCSLKIKLASKTLKNHMLEVSWFYLWAIPLSGSPLHLPFSFILSGIHVKNYIQNQNNADLYTVLSYQNSKNWLLRAPYQVRLAFAALHWFTIKCGLIHSHP